MSNEQNEHEDYVTRCECGSEFFFVTQSSGYRGRVDENGVLDLHKHINEEHFIECRSCDRGYDFTDFRDVTENW